MACQASLSGGFPRQEYWSVLANNGCHTLLLLLLLLSHFSCGLLGVIPYTSDQQASPSLSLGFSRQEHWSGLPFPSPRALYFLLPLLPTPLSIWCSQNPCNPSSFDTSTPGPHRSKPKSSGAASGENPSGQPTCRGGNKTTVETRGQCG